MQMKSWHRCKTVYKKKMIYLDYNATTPVDPAVKQAMWPFFDLVFGNPSSDHEAGKEAKQAIETARKRVADMLGAYPDEILFTSGGSESNNLALKGAAFSMQDRGNHLIISAVEHPAVEFVCRYLEKRNFRVTRLPVDQYGMVDPDDLKKAITSKTILISVMHANNETGTIQPLEAIGKIAKDHEILFHSDAAQSAGKIKVKVEDLGVDLLSLAGHKFYAPKGIGSLYVRRGVRLEKLIHGGDHEQDLRAGTENVPSIVGLGVAAQIIIPDSDAIMKLRDRLHHAILEFIPELRLNGHPEKRLPNTLSVGFPGVESNTFLRAMKGIAASAGAACHAGTDTVSGVLTAMKVPPEYARGTIRFSLGHFTTREEIEKAIQIISAAWETLHPSASNHRPWFIPRHSSEIRLTEYTRTPGCTCKIRPQRLEHILSILPHRPDPALLVGYETSDDATVYRLDDQRAIVQTVDFIPPVVNDPYQFGAIAAANALSDIYAMGGKPLFALNVVAYPENILPDEILEVILRGAYDKAAEAGISITGGHSIDDPELKFGLAVTGLVDPNHILRNSGALPGDALVLTKPIGTGIIITALQKGIASPDSIHKATGIMLDLNQKAANIMKSFPVHACTDVTGFGLLGHLKEMMTGASLGVTLFVDCIPMLDQVREYVAGGAIPGGTVNNLNFVKNLIHSDKQVHELMHTILADAQTSGGLLIALPKQEAVQLVSDLKAAGIVHAEIIGIFKSGIPEIHIMAGKTF
jgi:cysteine desulfurase NifS/selenium donor protein